MKNKSQFYPLQDEPTMTHYSEETKAQVMAALLTGQSVSTVAKEYNIPIGTIKTWSAKRDEVVESIQPQKRQNIGALLERYVETTIETLTKQAEIFADADWIKKQSASEVAVLHGVMADKAIRLIEAYEASGLADDNEG